MEGHHHLDPSSKPVNEKPPSNQDHPMEIDLENTSIQTIQPVKVRLSSYSRQSSPSPLRLSTQGVEKQPELDTTRTRTSKRQALRSYGTVPHSLKRPGERSPSPKLFKRDRSAPVKPRKRLTARKDISMISSQQRQLQSQYATKSNVREPLPLTLINTPQDSRYLTRSRVKLRKQDNKSPCPLHGKLVFRKRRQSTAPKHQSTPKIPQSLVVKKMVSRAKEGKPKLSLSKLLNQSKSRTPIRSRFSHEADGKSPITRAKRQIMTDISQDKSKTDEKITIEHKKEVKDTGYRKNKQRSFMTGIRNLTASIQQRFSKKKKKQQVQLDLTKSSKVENASDVQWVELNSEQKTVLFTGATEPLDTTLKTSCFGTRRFKITKKPVKYNEKQAKKKKVTVSSPKIRNQLIPVTAVTHTTALTSLQQYPTASEPMDYTTDVTDSVPVVKSTKISTTDLDTYRISFSPAERKSALQQSPRATMSAPAPKKTPPAAPKRTPTTPKRTLPTASKMTPTAPKMTTPPTSPKMTPSPTTPKMTTPPTSPKMTPPPTTPKMTTPPPTPKMTPSPTTPKMTPPPTAPKRIPPTAPKATPSMVSKITTPNITTPKRTLPTAPKRIPPTAPKMTPTATPKRTLPTATPKMTPPPTAPKMTPTATPKRIPPTAPKATSPTAPNITLPMDSNISTPPTPKITPPTLKLTPPTASKITFPTAPKITSPTTPKMTPTTASKETTLKLTPPTASKITSPITPKLSPPKQVKVIIPNTRTPQKAAPGDPVACTFQTLSPSQMLSSAGKASRGAAAAAIKCLKLSLPLLESPKPVISATAVSSVEMLSPSAKYAMSSAETPSPSTKMSSLHISSPKSQLCAHEPQSASPTHKYSSEVSNTCIPSQMESPRLQMSPSGKLTRGSPMQISVVTPIKLPSLLLESPKQIISLSPSKHPNLTTNMSSLKLLSPSTKQSTSGGKTPSNEMSSTSISQLPVLEEISATSNDEYLARMLHACTVSECRPSSGSLQPLPRMIMSVSEASLQSSSQLTPPELPNLVTLASTIQLVKHQEHSMSSISPRCNSEPFTMSLPMSRGASSSPIEQMEFSPSATEPQAQHLMCSGNQHLSTKHQTMVETGTNTGIQSRLSTSTLQPAMTVSPAVVPLVSVTQQQPNISVNNGQKVSPSNGDQHIQSVSTSVIFSTPSSTPAIMSSLKTQSIMDGTHTNGGMSSALSQRMSYTNPTESVLSSMSQPLLTRPSCFYEGIPLFRAHSSMTIQETTRPLSVPISDYNPVYGRSNFNSTILSYYKHHGTFHSSYLQYQTGDPVMTQTALSKFQKTQPNISTWYSNLQSNPVDLMCYETFDDIEHPSQCTETMTQTNLSIPSDTSLPVLSLSDLVEGGINLSNTSEKNTSFIETSRAVKEWSASCTLDSSQDQTSSTFCSQPSVLQTKQSQQGKTTFLKIPSLHRHHDEATLHADLLSIEKSMPMPTPKSRKRLFEDSDTCVAVKRQKTASSETLGSSSLLSSCKNIATSPSQNISTSQPTWAQDCSDCTHIENILSDRPYNVVSGVYNEDFSNKSTKEIITEYYNTTSFKRSKGKPHVVSKDLVWRLFTVGELYGNRFNTLNSATTDAIHLSVLDNTQCDEPTWRGTCIPFINRAIRDFFRTQFQKNKLLFQHKCDPSVC